MPKFKEGGAIQFIVLLILLVGIVGGVLLVTRGEPLKLLPKATVSGPIPSSPAPTLKTSPCEIYADMNLDGVITSQDVELASKVASGEIIPRIDQSGDTQYMSKVGDVNNDNKVDTTDSNLIQRYVDGLDSTFAVCQNAKSSPCGSLGEVTTNGTITPLDAYEVLRIVAGYKDSLYTKQPYTDDQRKRADVDGNKQITSVDGLHIRRYLAGITNTFKGCSTPSPFPTPTPTKRVFVTSTTYTGDLDGVAGADTKCQERANAASLSGTWKAWISDSYDSPSPYSGFVHSNGPYTLLNGQAIATNWNDLVDGSLLNSIWMTEFKSQLSGTTDVWTNTTAAGHTADNLNACGSWEIGSPSFQGYSRAGTSGSYNFRWTDDIDKLCNTQGHLYCFEQ